VKLVVVAVGQRVPAWAQAGWDEYAKRFPPELRVELKAVKTEARASKTLPNLLAAERDRITAAISPGSRIVALDEHGTALTTVALSRWSSAGRTGWTQPSSRPPMNASACPT
jgi:23S rRNA (pseudouridine1915-N3)-methyltransferase